MQKQVLFFGSDGVGRDDARDFLRARACERISFGASVYL